MSIYFLYALESIALDLFQNYLFIDAPIIVKIVPFMLRQLISEHFQKQYLSQIPTARLEKFMKECKHDSLSDYLDV